jgi:hypothetical protein
MTDPQPLDPPQLGRIETSGELLLDSLHSLMVR